jgi:hypothetical protein
MAIARLSGVVTLLRNACSPLQVVGSKETTLCSLFALMSWATLSLFLFHA